MLEHPEEFVGRIARIRAQEQFPSGAYRAPGLLAMHEDYPAMKASDSAIALVKEARKRKRKRDALRRAREELRKRHRSLYEDIEELERKEKKSSEVDWDKVHESADFFKKAFFGFGEPDPRMPKWMRPPTPPQKPKWMGGGGAGLDIRSNLLSLLLGTPVQSVRDARSAMGALSSIMNFFRNLGSRFRPAPTFRGDPYLQTLGWRR
jgi:hypothetical protein